MTLKERRLAAGMNQEELAKTLDVDQGTVSKWETGQSTPLRKYRRKLAELYGCDVGDIVSSIPENLS